MHSAAVARDATMPSHVSSRVSGVRRWLSITSSSRRYSSRIPGVIGCAPSKRSRNSPCSLCMFLSVCKKFSNRLLAVMQARLDRADRDAEHLRDLIDRQVLEEVQRQRLALEQRKLIERMMHLL